MPVIQLQTPHPAQAKVIAERKRWNVVSCGRRWGKLRKQSTAVILPMLLARLAEHIGCLRQHWMS